MSICIMGRRIKDDGFMRTRMVMKLTERFSNGRGPKSYDSIAWKEMRVGRKENCRSELTKNEKEMLRNFFSFCKISCATVLKMQFGIWTRLQNAITQFSTYILSVFFLKRIVDHPQTTAGKYVGYWYLISFLFTDSK